MTSQAGIGQRLIRMATGEIARTGLVRVGNVIIATLATAYIARALQPENFGLYGFVLSVLTIAAIPTTIGLRRTLTRETAYAMAQESTGRMYRIWGWCTRAALIASFVIGAGMALWAWQVTTDPELEAALIVAAVVLVLMPGPHIVAGALLGLNRAALSQIPEFIFRPLVLLALVVLIHQFAPPLSVPMVLASYGAGVLVATVVGVWFLRRHAPVRMQGEQSSDLAPKALILSSVSFGAIASVQLINSNLSMLVLGSLGEAESAGLYKASEAVSALVSFGLVVVNMVIMPRIARHHAREERDQLQALVTRGARLISVAALCGMLAVILGGKFFLELLFGTAYTAAYTALLILAVGQFANALFGPVSIVLNMIGYERLTLIGVSVAAVLNIALNLLLVPPLGMIGAAIATAAATLAWNVLLAVLLWRMTGIDSTFLGRGRSHEKA